MMAMAAIWRQQLQRFYKSMLWLRTLRLENFGSLGSRVVWFVYALRMSSHDVRALNCQSPNACRPFEIHINSIGPTLSCGIAGCHCDHDTSAFGPCILQTNFILSTMLGRQAREQSGFSASSVCMNLRKWSLSRLFHVRQRYCVYVIRWLVGNVVEISADVIELDLAPRTLSTRKLMASGMQ